MLMRKKWKTKIHLQKGDLSPSESQKQFFLSKNDIWSAICRSPYVAKYHLGKVKLETTPVHDLQGIPWGIAGLLVCSFASFALHCSFAC